MAGFERPKDGYRFGFGGLKTNDSADAMNPSKHPVAENVRSHGGHYVYTRPGYDFLFTANILSIESCPTGTLEVGVPYSFQLVAFGGTAPYTWFIEPTDLPDGLTLNTSTGLISGTPTTDGTFPYVVQVTDSSNPPQTVETDCSLTVGTGPMITSSCPSVQPVLDEAYSYTFTATGGALPYVWTITSGTLPDGLTLDEDTGEISGTPTETGSFPYTITVTDANDQSDHLDCTFIIAEITEFRPTSFQEYEDDPPVNPARSRIVNGAFCEDNDAPIGTSLTAADCQIDSTGSVVFNYAQLFAYDFPDPDPMQTLVSATVFVRCNYDQNGATGGEPISAILVLNAYSNDWPTPSSFIDTIYSNAGGELPVADYSKTYSAAQFATHFSSLGSNVYVRAQQYHSLNQSFSATIHLYWYDTWIEYAYV